MKKKDLALMKTKMFELEALIHKYKDDQNWLSEHLIELNALQQAYNAQSEVFANQNANANATEEMYWNEGDETTVKSWNIIPETDYNFQVQLLAECDDLVRWWIGKLNLKFADDKFYDVFYKAFHIAFLFEPVCFYSSSLSSSPISAEMEKIRPELTAESNKPSEAGPDNLISTDDESYNPDLDPDVRHELLGNNKGDEDRNVGILHGLEPDPKGAQEGEPQGDQGDVDDVDKTPSGDDYGKQSGVSAANFDVYRISKIEGDKAYIYKAVDFEKDNYTKYITNDNISSAEVIEVPADQIYVLNLWHYGTIKFGMFVRLIQAGLQHKIYLDRIRQKNESFLQVICDTSEVGRRKPSWITRFFTIFVRDKSKDNQNSNSPLSGSTDLSKVKWFSPAEQEKTYQMLNDAIEKEYEKVCQIIGKDTTAADSKQTLATEANTYGQSYLCIQQFVMSQVFRCLDKMGIQYDQWKFDIQQIEQPEGGQNDNAVEAEPKTLHKEKKGEIE